MAIVTGRLSKIIKFKINVELTHELREFVGLLCPGGVVHGIAAKLVDIDLPGLAGLNSDLRILGGGGAGLPFGLNVEAHLGLHLPTLEIIQIIIIIIITVYYFFTIICYV